MFVSDATEESRQRARFVGDPADPTMLNDAARGSAARWSGGGQRGGGIGGGGGLVMDRRERERDLQTLSYKNIL